LRDNRALFAAEKRRLIEDEGRRRGRVQTRRRTARDIGKLDIARQGGKRAVSCRKSRQTELACVSFDAGVPVRRSTLASPKPSFLSVLQDKEPKAGTGIEPVSSGFADRGLTTWLPRRLILPEPIHRLLPLSPYGARRQLLPFSKTLRTWAHVRPRTAHRSVSWPQRLPMLPRWLECQREEETLVLQG
jgi:hypothetical protein